MFTEILNSANLYAEGLKLVEEKRAQWIIKHVELKDHLKEIADYLNANAGYKQGFYIDTLHAFNEEMNGTCADMPSITFRTGEMPMMMTFKNSIGERREYMEQGFRITFNPTVTGEIIVLLLPHSSDLNKTPPPYTTLAIITVPGEFTMNMAEEIIAKGIEIAYYSSFTGVAAMQPENDQQEPTPAPHHDPIGFKRYETTEKIRS